MGPVEEKTESVNVREGGMIESIMDQLEEAMDRLELPSASRTFLKNPQHEMRFQIPAKKADGSVDIYPAFRVKWNMARGPAKGGLRFHPDETIDDIRALACGMTLKTAVMDLPLGGGKGGVICNPKEMSERELEQLSRGYIQHLSQQLGPSSDVPAPDVYTNPQMMAWMMDEYEKITGENLTGVVTGKPVELGGSQGREGATARGGMYAVREAARVMDIDLEGKKAAIQGYGKAGEAAHKLAQDILGMKVVAVSDSKGGVYNDNGLDYNGVSESKQKTESVVNYPTAETIDSEDILELDVAVLFPAALENVITEDNADDVQAEIIAELANGPTTSKADKILDDKGTYVIPDLLCNAGGLIVSYFEQVQNADNYYWQEQTVHERLDHKMVEAFGQVHEVAIDRGIHKRLAAYQLGVERINKAMKLRGWV